MQLLSGGSAGNKASEIAPKKVSQLSTAKAAAMSAGVKKAPVSDEIVESSTSSLSSPNRGGGGVGDGSLSSGLKVEEEIEAVVPNPPPVATGSPPLPATSKADRPLAGLGEAATGYDLSALDGSDYGGRYGNILKLLNSYVSERCMSVVL